MSAAGLFLAAGYWHMSSEQIARYRRSVADDVAGPLLERAVAALARKKLPIGGEQLSRVPSGFEKDHPRADLLRHKSLTTACDLGAPAWLSTPKTKTEIVRTWKGMTPLATWLDAHVGRD